MIVGEKRVLVFDLDGTLIDSLGDLNQAANRLLRELDRPGLTPDEMRPMVGDGVAKLIERVLAARPGPAIALDAALDRFVALYEAAPAEATRAYPEVPETLTALRDAGFRLAVCTNKPEKLTRLILDRLGLARYFELVVGGDTLPFRKPDPRLLSHVTIALGVPIDQAMMIGDSEVDAATAEAAGMAFVLMTYGYHRGSVDSIPCAAALDRFGQLLDTIPSLV
jgi:phosphoglycolate phosphatase